MMKPELRRKLAGVRMFLCDVDGVLTDGMVLMGNGVESKRFNIVDGLGMRLLQKAGIKVGWVSRRPSSATSMRAEDLKIDYLIQIDGSKVEAVGALLDQSGTKWGEVCYVGDDIVDLGVLQRVGVAVGVANAIDEVKAVADYVTERAGGYGAVREVIDLILKAQGRWAAMIQEHSQ
jgi:3-deoxy-D-manno-octulosonate 8-phosphate phosphatase (KDO 8-P phosphatase)